MVTIDKMEMPKTCGKCRLCHHESAVKSTEKGWFCYGLFPAKSMALAQVQEGKRPEWCPLKEIKKNDVL